MIDKTLLGLKGMRGAFALLLVSTLAQSALTIGQAVTLSQAIANLWEGQPLDGQIVFIAAFFGCFATRHLLAALQGELIDRFADKTVLNLKSELLNLVFSDEAPMAQRLGTAATAVAVTEGIDDIARYIRTIPPRLCFALAGSSCILIALIVTDWISGIIACMTLPVIGLFMVMLGRQARARSERHFDESQRLSNHFIDTLRGIESISALGAGKRAGESIWKASERLRTATVRMLSVATLSSAILDLVTVLGIAAIAMMLAFRLMDGSIALSAALAALMLAPDFFAPIRSYASSFHASLDGKNALEATFRILELGRTASRYAPETTSAIPSATNTLEARDVSYTHDDGTVGISDVSFCCEGHRTIGIVGLSGSGKSTLVSLLAGFKAPISGSFAINGSDVNLQSPEWKRRLHYIPQKPYIFHATLDENIRFYAPHATHDDVIRAVRTVGLDKLVSDLPQGLETLIGEGARGLSGGEAQRIALARVLLDDRKVLLFDEPTAHLDIETELELKRRMIACMKGRLVFFATHRLHWLNDMDLVIVLEGGGVAEVGVPSELLAHDGALKRFVEREQGGDAA